MQPTPQPLILASQSRYRQTLLARLNLAFSTQAAHVDETPLDQEDVADVVMRLGLAKANKIASQAPDAWIIASDQSSECDGVKLGKSGNFSNALTQLQQMQGKRVTFFTSLILQTPQGTWQHLDATEVYFRQLNTAQLSRYLEQEQPYDCAGSFKSEGLGIALFDRIESQDPSALIGLPMITLAKWLTDQGKLLK